MMFLWQTQLSAIGLYSSYQLPDMCGLGTTYDGTAGVMLDFGSKLGSSWVLLAALVRR